MGDDDYTNIVRKDKDSCFVWKKYVEIKGLKDGGVHEPFDPYHGELSIWKITDSDYMTGGNEKNFWIGPLRRNANFERTRDVEVAEVRAEHYRMSAKTLLNDCTSSTHTK